MAKAKRGATRKTVSKPKQTIAWNSLGRQAMIVLAFGVIAAAVIYTKQSNILPITHVSVEGEFKHTDKAQLVEKVKPYTIGSFLSIDVDKISEAGEVLPWVRQVQVRRIWPDGLHLTVEEQTPIAKWGKQGYVNNDGELFPESNQKIDGEMALLTGPEQSERLMTYRYISMNKELKPLGLKVTSLTMDERRAWRLALNNDMQIDLGRADSEQRFNRFVNVYKQTIQPYAAQIAELDMRYPNGLSVVWKQGQKPAFNGTI